MNININIHLIFFIHILFMYNGFIGNGILFKYRSGLNVVKVILNDNTFNILSLKLPLTKVIKKTDMEE